MQIHASARIRLFSALFGLALVACLATMALVRTAEPVSAAGVPLVVTFTKWNTGPGVGVGVVGGDVVGTLAFQSSAVPSGVGPIAQIEARYQISAGAHSFTALTEGIRNNQTGKRTFNGVITDGWLLGAQVHVEFLGGLTNCNGAPAGPCFQGTITIFPASAN